jgi:hypothetical protein
VILYYTAHFRDIIARPFHHSPLPGAMRAAKHAPSVGGGESRLERREKRSPPFDFGFSEWSRFDSLMGRSSWPGESAKSPSRLSGDLACSWEKSSVKKFFFCILANAVGGLTGQGGHGQAAQRTTARQRRAAQCRALRVLGAVRNSPAPRAFGRGPPSAAPVPPRAGGGGTPPRRRGAGRRAEPPARRSQAT